VAEIKAIDGQGNIVTSKWQTEPRHRERGRVRTWGKAEGPNFLAKKKGLGPGGSARKQWGQAVFPGCRGEGGSPSSSQEREGLARKSRKRTNGGGLGPIGGGGT